MKKWMATCGALLVLAGAGGCALDEMRKDNERRETRVQSMQAELDRVEQANRDLQAERVRLRNDLSAREMSISEMEQRLQALKRLNAATRSPTDTPEKQRQQAARDRQIDDAAGQLRAAREDTNASQEAKARRSEEIRRQLRKMLELAAGT